MATATHQQNGQHCGRANGNQEAQKPDTIGTVVRSRCQTWLGFLAVTTRPVETSDCLATGRGGSLNIRPTVVALRCNPARASVWAILTLPMVGQRVFNRCTA